MSRRNPLRLKIASPCQVDWSSMAGDDAVRHCGECKKDVYNLSEMTTAQVEALLHRAGGTPCVRFFQRHDGTVITGDCPVGAKAVRRKRTLAGLGAGALAAFGLALAPSVSPAGEGAGDHALMGAMPEGVHLPTDGSGEAGSEREVEPVEPETMGRAVMGEPMLPPDLDR